MSTDIIYLDHAAATPMDERVIAAMQPYLTEKFFNPSSPYAPAVAVRREYEDARSRIAQAVGAKADELVMTAGATESINLMFGSVTGHVVTTAIEHHAVLAAARQHDHTIVAVGPSGVVDVQAVIDAVRDDTTLVSVGLANNELGTVQPLRDIAEKLRAISMQRREAGNTTPLYFHTDASQGVGHIDVNIGRLGVDALTLNAGKIYGPKQVGLLWTASHVHLEPVVVGGGQERGLRNGTENVAGVIGFATAIELAQGHRKSESERLAALRDTLEQRLLEAFPDAVINGSQKRRLPGHLHLSFPDIDAERLVFGLESRGVLVATGSACAANKGTRSHVLTAIGVSDEVADGSLRLTLGRLSDESTIARAADILIETISREQQRTQHS